MTDIVTLAARLYDRIEWQNVPDDVTQDDLTALVADAIRFLYVVTGKMCIRDRICRPPENQRSYQSR